jgi:hypothetical protein
MIEYKPNAEGKFPNPDGSYFYCPLTNETAMTKEELEIKAKDKRIAKLAEIKAEIELSK